VYAVATSMSATDHLQGAEAVSSVR
jgi:hypothetical protein